MNNYLNLRRIFDLPKSTPKISLYVLSGKTPLRYIIKTRRLLFYWHILHLDEKELLYRFLCAQTLKPSKNDWILEVYKNLDEINLKISEQEIKNMSKGKFKHLVQQKINMSVKKDFQKIQSKQSKTSNLRISDSFSAAKFLFSKNLCVEEIKTLMRIKTRTVDVKQNQKSSNQDNMLCRTCHLDVETQQHLFQCLEIRKRLDYLTFTDLNYDMVAGKIEEQEKFAKIYHLILEAREDILNQSTSPSSTGGPVHRQ